MNILEIIIKMDFAKAEEKKKQGNDEHKKGNYPAAVKLYTDAIGKELMFYQLFRFQS